MAVCPLAASAVETLESAWADAYGLNPSLQAQRAALRATDEQVSQALSHWRPSIDANAHVGRTWQRVPGLDVFGSGHYASEAHGGGVKLTQPIFRGFRTIEETEAAKQQVMEGRAKLQQAEQQLFLDTATTFLHLVRDQAILDAQRDNVQVLKDKLTETQVRYQHGDLTQTDVQQAQARLARGEVSRMQAENSVEEDRASYQRLIGHMPGTLSNKPAALALPATLEDTLQKIPHNPGVTSAEFAVEEEKAEVKLNKGSLLPEVNLVASRDRDWGQSSTIPGREDSSQVMVQATMPLYRSGEDYSRIRAAEQTLTQRKMELDEARHKATEDARNGWMSLLTARTASDADRNEVTADTKALKGVTIESKVGTRTMLDVLNAEQELLDAKIDLARSQHDEQLAMVQIRAAIGELTADQLKLPVTYYDPATHYNDVKGQWIGFSKDDAQYQVPTSGEQ
ncbi:MAG TPA: TolC family outer membrane protein [Rickettsiales bacterium]|nr:TolC family outer membrane protein [Rickettsiales bacterium]